MHRFVPNVSNSAGARLENERRANRKITEQGSVIIVGTSSKREEVSSCTEGGVGVC